MPYTPASHIALPFGPVAYTEDKMETNEGKVWIGTKSTQEILTEALELNEDLSNDNINLKKRNVILVAVNRSLRERLMELEKEADELVSALYEADKEQELDQLDSIVYEGI